MARWARKKGAPPPEPPEHWDAGRTPTQEEREEMEGPECYPEPPSPADWDARVEAGRKEAESLGEAEARLWREVFGTRRW